MDQIKVHAQRHIMNYGALAGLSFTTVHGLFYFFSNFFSPNIIYFNIFIHTFFIITAVTIYRDHFLNGIITYKKALSLGTQVIFWASIIYAFFIFLMYKIIDPALIDQYLKLVEDTLLQSNFSKIEVDTLLNMDSRIFSPIALGLSVLVSRTLGGFILSLFIAGMLKRNEVNKN